MTETRPLSHSTTLRALINQSVARRRIVIGAILLQKGIDRSAA